MEEKKITSFTFVNAINNGNEHFLKNNQHGDYKPFLVNRAFSYWVDTIFQSNTMNMYTNIPNNNQYDYYISSIRPRKRFAKWVKTVDNDLVQMISEVFEVNYNRALDIIPLLSEEQLKEIKMISGKNE